MSVKHFSACLLLLLGLAACGYRTGAPAATASPAELPKSPEIVALEAAQSFLEGHLGRELQGIEVAYGPAQWPDASMDCPQEGAVYEQVPTSGYEFQMTVEGVTYRLHINADGSSVLLCPPLAEETAALPAGPVLPPVLEAPLARSRELLVQFTGVSSDTVTLDLLAWEPVTFTSTALGCPQVGVAYQELPLPGYSLQLGFFGETYEVHSDLSGDLIVLCQAPAQEAPPPAEGAAAELPAEIQAPFIEAHTLLAGVLGVDPATLTIEGLGWERVTFPSTALGCPRPGQEYLDVETEGYVFSLVYGGMPYTIHTDLVGNTGVLCLPEETAEAPAGDLGGMVFSSYSDPQLGVGASYPLGWTVQPNPGEAELYFGPAGDPSRGMIISRAVIDTGAIETWLSDYQLALYASDPTAVAYGDRESVRPGALSRRYSLELQGLPVIQRTTFFASGYRVIQWAPQSEWAAWDDAFLQILDSLVVESAP